MALEAACAQTALETAQLEAQLDVISTTASHLGERIAHVDEALSAKCDATSLTNLAQQLEQLTASKAGRHARGAGCTHVAE